MFGRPTGRWKNQSGEIHRARLGRESVRMALGGVRDEAEIRGHRRTYIGALPGRIVQGLRDAGTNNPVMILDEIDKLGSDYRGDPTSALLEVLDPQQNDTFQRSLSRSAARSFQSHVHHDGQRFGYDSAAAARPHGNYRHSGLYRRAEKVAIARRHLLPRQMEENGLRPEDLFISQGALRQIARGYTREAGVRNLEREVGRVCRKVARKIAEAIGVIEAKKMPVENRNKRARNLSVTAHNLRHEYLDQPQSRIAKWAVASRKSA